MSAAMSAEPRRPAPLRARLAVVLVGFGLMLNAAWLGAVAWLPLSLLW